jgi:divalent metal cation (Fe/Co/Zn/Cd) transporter
MRAGRKRRGDRKEAVARGKADREKGQKYRIAFGLALFTIVFNIAEGLVSTYFGYEDKSLTLAGFGADSFIEVVSGLGIAHMIARIQRHPDSRADAFERTALRITGFSFYGLVVGLFAMSIHNILSGHKPTTTLWGIIVSVISITVMSVLVWRKRQVGKQLGSEAILADAECTRVCIYMSIVLLAASAVYELTRIAYIDVMGTLGIAYFSFREGRECFEKAAGTGCCTDGTKVEP